MIFIPLVMKAITEIVTSTTIQNRFCKCGFFLLSPNNVDYFKCIKDISHDTPRKEVLEIRTYMYGITAIVMDRESGSGKLGDFRKIKRSEGDPSGDKASQYKLAENPLKDK